MATNVGNTLNEALAHHQAGRLPEAEAIYRQILAAGPNHADATHMLGLVMYQTGRSAEAVDLVRRAVTLNPGQLPYLHNLALILSHAGRLGEAAQAYRRAVALAPSAEMYNNLGNALLADRQFADAADAYRHAAALRPDAPEILRNLARVLLEAARPDEADDACRRAIALRPDHPDAHYHLGIACGMRGRWDYAIPAFTEAARLRPDYAEAYNNLGNAYSETGRYAQAEVAYRRALALRPDLAQAHNNLGVALQKQGRNAEAVSAYRESLRRRPPDAKIYYQLANALKDAGQPDEAIEAARQALALRPDHAETYVTLSLIHADRGQWNEAFEAANTAAAVRPAWEGAYNNLGYLLHLQGRDAEAVTQLRHAIALNPKYLEAYVNLGTAYHELGKLDESIDAYRAALAISNRSAEAHINLANGLKDAGLIRDALAEHRIAAALNPDPERRHNLLLTTHYVPGLTAARILDDHLAWARDVTARVAGERRSWEASRAAARIAPDRPLRIGYVSADFRNHVVGWNILPLLENHDPARFEVFCYSNLARTDDLTARFRKLAHQWREIHTLTDAQAAERIVQDRIDVLIDLSLHSAGTRLGIFARKPAPVQVTFAGYPGTTGLSEIDYRLTDPHLDPPGTDAFYSERSWRLPHSFWCYQPTTPEVTVTPLPALTTGHVTFGALTNFCKVNEDVLRLWARVLVAVPGSRLLLVARQGAHRARTRDLLAAAGVGADRVEFLDYQPRVGYLKSYDRVDVGLDTLPYNGHTTSLDSFWMGVPVVTLVGETAVGRAGLCQLSNMGMTELAARTPDDFVRIAVDLATDLPRLARIRAGLRSRMEDSPLMDAKKFTRDIEAAYRQMWQNWLG